jgi:hypothetical protein
VSQLIENCAQALPGIAQPGTGPVPFAFMQLRGLHAMCQLPYLLVNRRSVSSAATVTSRTPVSVHHGASRSSGNTRAEGLPVVTTSRASRASTRRRAWRIAGLPKRQHADRGYLTHAQVAALADAVERDGTVVRFLA